MDYIWKDRKRNALGLPWTFTKYALTDDRLFIEKGLFTTTQSEVRLYRIMDLTLKRTLGQKIFGIGTIQVSSSDQTEGNFELKNIKRSKDVLSQLSDLVETNREKKRIHAREYMTAHDEDGEVEDIL